MPHPDDNDLNDTLTATSDGDEVIAGLDPAITQIPIPHPGF